MVETSSVIFMIIGLTGLFTGSLFALVALSVRKPIEQLTKASDDHGVRIRYLEARDSVREEQIGNILQGIEAIKQMFEKHEAKG